MHSSRSVGARVSPALWILVAALVLLGVPAPARAQMPDLRQMSGQPLPSGDLPAGSLSVRVVRGSISNNVAGQDVRLEGGGPARTVKTDASGRALFSGLAPGTIWRATTTVDGERVDSQAIEMPANGGLRVLLAAGLGGAAAPAGTPGADGAARAGAGAATAGAGTSAGPMAGASTPAAGAASAPAASSAPAVPGTVAFGSQSRFVIELAEGSIEVYGLLDIVNLAAAPVMPAAPIVIEAPAEASNTNVLEGSSPQAKAEGRKVTITGPFVPGNTSVQIAYRVRYDGSRLQLTQVLPLALPQTTVIVRKFGALQASVAGMIGQREVPLEGRTYLVVNGKAVATGGQVELTLTGLPHLAAWPKNTALALAVLLLVGGIVLSLSPAPSAQADADAATLRARRARVFDQLVAVERTLRDRPSEAPAAREERLARRAALIDDIQTLDEALASVLPASPAGAARPADATGTERLRARQAAR